MSQKEFSDIKRGKANKIVMEEKDELRINVQKPKLIGKIKSKSVNDIFKKSKDYLYLNRDNPRLPEKFKESIRIAVIAFIMFLFFNFFNIYFLAIAIKDDALKSAYAGFKNLLTAGEDIEKSNFERAYSAFSNSYESFSSAQNNLWFLHKSRDLFIKNDKIADSVEGIILSGKHLAMAGLKFSDTIQSIREIIDMVAKENNKSHGTQASITNSLKNEIEKIEDAYNEILEANTQFKRIDDSIFPPELRPKFEEAKTTITELLKQIEDMHEDIPTLMKLLGDKLPHRYLILLQNDNEIRPTGGFIGSFMILDFNDGYITKKEIHDVYEYDNAYTEHVEAPFEIAELTNEWRLRDSNYSPDFKISAEKAAWFLEKEGGPTVDSVIAINQSVIKDLVGAMGEIQLPNLAKPLNTENFTFIISYIVESKIKGANNPKIILNDLMNALTEKLISEKKWGEIFNTISAAIKEKEILAYSKDPDIQDFFRKYSLAGEVKELEQNEDYVQVVAASISGNKSDRLMTQEIIHETSIDSTDKIIDKITVKRKHNFNPQIGIRWEELLSDFGFSEFSDGLKDIMGRGGNRVILRVYVPKGSEIISTEGVDAKTIETRLDTDLQKTYFKLNVFTKAGEETVFSIRYFPGITVDFSPVNDYKFVIQKQPGPLNSNFTKKLYLLNDLTLLRYYPLDAYFTENDVMIYSSLLNTDQNMAVLLAN